MEETPGKNNPSLQVSMRNTQDGERFNRTLFTAVEALEAKNIDYGFIGGIAASGIGRPRATHDIDIFVRPEDAESALRALADFDFITERTDPNWLFKGWKEDILIDVIFKSSGDIYFDEEMSKRARTIDFHGRKLRAVAAEDLIVIKCAVHNEIGPHHWHDALSILSSAQVDWDYLLRRSRRAQRRLLALLIYAQSNDIWIPNQIVIELYNRIYGDVKTNAPMVSHASVMSPVHEVPVRGNQAMHQKPFISNASGSHFSRQAIHAAQVGHATPYIVGHIREAMALDERVGDIDIKIHVGDSSILMRGESFSEQQREAIEEVVKRIVPGYQIENQITVPVLPGPEGVESIQ